MNKTCGNMSVHKYLPLLITAFLASQLPQEVSSENILFYTGCGSYSQRISVWPLVEALVEKGHNITFLSAYPAKVPHPKVTDFVPKKLQKWWTKLENDIDLYYFRTIGILIPFSLTAPHFGTSVCEQLYEDPEAIAWIKSSKFDLVFIDSFVNDCAYGLAHVFKAKTIGFGTSTVNPWWYEGYGLADDTSWVPDMIFHFPHQMNFFQRAINAFLPVYWKFVREYWYFPRLEAITRKGLGVDNFPSFSELERNTSLAFVTSHFAQDHPRAFPPNMIPIGGLVLSEKRSPLPKEIEDFINKGKNGFVYISFGTFAEFVRFDPEVKEAFVDGLLKFPHLQFIWKSKEDLGMELPHNFLILKWAPQQDLLAHRKIQTFITHAGLGSINEAIYYGVPLVSFPLFAEQDYNANLLVSKGIGIKMEMTTLKSEELEQALSEMISTDRYRKRMQSISRIFKERPLSALQTAVWWTEFVLTHDEQELELLRSPATMQYWWVKRQLDVWIFILVISILSTSITMCLTYKLTKRILRRIFVKGSDSKGNEKRNRDKKNK